MFDFDNGLLFKMFMREMSALTKRFLKIKFGDYLWANEQECNRLYQFFYKSEIRVRRVKVKEKKERPFRVYKLRKGKSYRLEIRG